MMRYDGKDKKPKREENVRCLLPRNQYSQTTCLNAAWSWAPGYDRDNKFFEEGFKELKEAGYMLAAVPKELGGLGLNLAQICQEQRRLGYHAAATALAVNMHFY